MGRALNGYKNSDRCLHILESNYACPSLINDHIIAFHSARSSANEGRSSEGKGWGEKAHGEDAGRSGNEFFACFDHHIIDLRTGYPARGSVAVTVIAKSAMIADAYATGLFILGPREGLALAESLPDLEALFFTPTGEVVTTQGAQVFSYELKDRWYH